MAQAPNPFEQQKAIPGVQKIIAIGAGKGGVGKSTIALNLAVAMAKLGKKVGLLDADIYGPSLPRLIGTLHQKPMVKGSESNPNEQNIMTIDRYGIKTMSIGYMIPEARGLVWRGPMLFKTMDQFLRQVHWGELDYLFIDLPPGTGDVALSVAQKVPCHGAVVVTTPQNMSIADVERALDMFQTLGVPLLGCVENMAGYLHSQTKEILPLFPSGDLERIKDQKHISTILKLPFTADLAKASEIGIPLVESSPTSMESTLFLEAAQRLIDS